MIRKILPFLLTACLVCTCTGCMGRDNDVSSTVSGSSSTARPTAEPEVSALPDASSAAPESSLPGSGSSGSDSSGSGSSGADSSGSGSGSSGSGSSGTGSSGAGTSGNGSSGTGTVGSTLNAGSFGPFRDALQGVYGDKYYPDTQLTEEEIRSELGLDDDLYDEIYAERSGESGRPDMFIAVKAEEGKAEQVKEKLTAYKQKLGQNKDFADAADRIDAAQIYAEGDYVFFLLAGEAEAGGSSGGMAEQLGKEVQRGIDAIKEALGMM